MRGRPIVYQTLESGCIVPTSHKLNRDGYFRVRDYRFTGEGRKPLVMSHRLKYEEAYGTIPNGYEVDHMCRTRHCCNVEHLQLLTVVEHRVKTNTERYADRKNEAYELWSETECSGTVLAKVFGVSFSAACGWIREWKV